jgi:UvrD/REP helicase N-terminal domain
MGKQRKGGPKAKVKERKEQKKEKRAQANEDAKRKASREHVDAIFDELHLDNSLLVGRLYYFLPDVAYDRNDANSRRGILDKVIGDEADDTNSTAVFVPIVPLDDSDSHRATVPLGNVVRQRVAWTLRYGVGHSVVVYDEGTDAYVEAKVEYLWPVWLTPKTAFGKDRSAKLVLYQCRTMDMEQRIILVSKDENRYIQRLPTDFRFSPGDRVLVCTERSFCTNVPKRVRVSSWHMGTIADTHVLDQMRYACYECELDGVGFTCYVRADSDAYVVSASATPRERLFSAMEDPEFTKEDFSFLIESCGIEVSAFYDLVAAKVIENASYGGMSLLRIDITLGWDGLQDANGDGFLHQLALSPHVGRFLKPSSKKITADFALQCLVGELNRVGRVWVEHLLENPTVSLHDFELALSPDIGLGRFLSCGSGERTEVIARRLSVLRDDAWGRRRFEVARMANYLVSTLPVNQASHIFVSSFSTKRLAYNVLLERFELGDRIAFVKWFVQILYERRDETPIRTHGLDYQLVCNLQGNGVGYIELLLERVPAFASIAVQVQCASDRSEFLEHDDGAWVDESVAMPLVEAVAIHRLQKTMRFLVPAKEDRSDYYVHLRLHCCDHKDNYKSLIALLRKEAASTNGLFKYRLSLLEDDPSLESRLSLLKTLIMRNGAPPPHPLNLVRCRQCGVIRWLVAESVVHLNIQASCMQSALGIVKPQFLGGCSIPKQMILAEYLCFASVEFDDLQSLQWLTSEHGVNILSLVCNGWGICHAVAAFGRAEITLWLEEFEGFRRSVRMFSKRKGEETKLPVHLALERGHCFVVDRLLAHDKPNSEILHQSLMQIAKGSGLEHVQDWVQEREKPFKLSSDVQRLVRLLRHQPPSWSTVVTHILDSQCLDLDRWIDSGKWWGDAPYDEGPWRISRSYIDLLLECLRWRVGAGSSVASTLVIGAFRPNHRRLSNRERLRCVCILSGLSHDDSETTPMEKAKLLTEFSRMPDGAALKDLIYRTQAWQPVQFVPYLVCDPEVDDPIFSCMIQQVRERANPTDLLVVSEIRDKILKIDFLREVRHRAETRFRYLVTRGLDRSLVEDVVAAFQESSLLLAVERGIDVAATLYSHSLMSADGVLNASFEIETEYESSKFSGMFMGERKVRPPLYLFLAMEDYVHLSKWLMSRPSDLDAQHELEMVRIAVVFGSHHVVDLFLSPQWNDRFRSSRETRLHVAVLGAVAAGNLSVLDDFYALAGKSLPADPLNVEACMRMDSSNQDETRRSLSASISACAVHGYLLGSESSISGNKAVCRWLVLNESVTSSALLFAMSRILWCIGTTPNWERIPQFLAFLTEELKLDPLGSFKDVKAITEFLLSFASYSWATKIRRAAVDWTALLVQQGVDIQQITQVVQRSEELDRELNVPIKELRASQVCSWAAFDVVKTGNSLECIRHAVAENPTLLTLRDRGGLSFTHVAAAYDRLDVVVWLVTEMNQTLESHDNDGQSVVAVARVSGSSSVVAWIEKRRAKEVISLFLSRHLHSRLAFRRRLMLLSSITKLQAWIRRVMVVKMYGTIVLSRLESLGRFRCIWYIAMDVILNEGSLCESAWSFLRETRPNDMRTNCAEDLNQRLDEAVRATLTEEMTEDEAWRGTIDEKFQEVNSARDEDEQEYGSLGDFECSLSNPLRVSNRVCLTTDVLKWCRTSDAKYLGFFLRRIEQLASGERSRILAKRLKGCFNAAIFETYLEQKTGNRVLWTELASGDVLVWYVVTHKKVSRFARLIDLSLGRSNRQLADALPILGLVPSLEVSTPPEAESIVLDPLGNTPLKLYAVTSDRIQSLANASWTPPLRLTPEERLVVEATGTTLVLGRSGTGKTICLCNRMDFDRNLFSGDDSFSQLFIARSERLSRFVRRTVGDFESCCFTTFQDLLSTLESSLAMSTAGSLFLPSRRVDFALFKRDVFRDAKLWGGLDALVLWTNVRSYVKGSIEALASPGRILSYDDYVSVEKLGKKRCRLSPEHRPEVYKAFRAYSKYLEETGRWDDCDRVSSLLERLQAKKDEDPESFEALRYSKIYVDEVQDYTQAEILLFFYLSRPGDLFLCGDPAQSVVDGVEFRFEEIRSVAHFVAGADRRHLVPQKPLTVNVNFRSHSGILNVAAAVLSRMFAVFPDSAKQLKEDRGLFIGPRPGVLYKADLYLLNCALASVLSGTTILVHDDQRLRCSQLLDDYQLLYGIREAKGLEFKSVLLFDFFAGIPQSLQKSWRALLLGRQGLDFASLFPEVEGQLKLLYTAITRSIDRLLFVESKASIAGEAFSRWLTTNTTRAAFRSDEPLAVRQRVSDVESLKMSVDEWLVSGLENAEAADDSPDPDTAESFLAKALHCFEQANHGPYAAKARAHRTSAQFRSQLERDLSKNLELAMTGELEASVARLLATLFRESLWMEAAKVCQLVLPHLPEYTQEQLRVHVLPKLPRL